MEAQINAFSTVPAGSKKKVLFVVTQSEMGGAQQFLFQLLKHLDRSKFEPLIAVGCDGDGEFIRALRTIGLEALTVSSLRRNAHPFADLRAIGDLRELIQELQPHTVFLCSSKAGFIGSRAARGATPRPRIIYRIGGWTFNDPWPSYKKWMWRTLEKMSSSWKDIIIVNNTHDLEQARRLSIKGAVETVLIHNGIDPYIHTQTTPSEAKKGLLELIGRTENPPRYIVGTIANHYPAKGLEYLVSAAALSLQQDTVFVVIGDGPERGHLTRIVEEKDLSQNVFLIGRVPHPIHYLPGFDVFVLPSVKEGFPWSVLEAMSAKVPVIATRVGAIPEMIESEHSGVIVEPRHPEQIAQALEQLLPDDSRRQAMAIEAHQRLISLFSVQQMVSRIESLL